MNTIKLVLSFLIYLLYNSHILKVFEAGLFCNWYVLYKVCFAFGFYCIWYVLNMVWFHGT